jgi:hypothetical protein
MEQRSALSSAQLQLKIPPAGLGHSASAASFSPPGEETTEGGQKSGRLKPLNELARLLVEAEGSVSHFGLKTGPKSTLPKLYVPMTYRGPSKMQQQQQISAQQPPTFEKTKSDIDDFNLSLMDGTAFPSGMRLKPIERAGKVTARQIQKSLGKLQKRL